MVFTKAQAAQFTAANGTMRVISGSFRTPYEHSRDGDSGHHVRRYPPEEEAVLVELPAGGALFFAYGVAHATGANGTDRERAGMALHFLNESVAGAAHGMEGGSRGPGKRKWPGWHKATD